MEPSEHLEEKHIANPPSWRANCRCLLHWQEQGGQDHAFQFRDGLVNYKTYYDLYWFRPLLGGNSHTSSNLILKMKRGYNGVSRELEKFTCEGKNDLIHPA
jgi:hypothetical protein